MTPKDSRLVLMTILFFSARANRPGQFHMVREWGELVIVKVTLVCLLLGCPSFCPAQESSPRPARSINVQRLFKFSAALTNSHRSIGTVALRFAIYNEPYGGEAYWQELQNVRPDAQGKYTVLLGETTPGGLPPDIFASGGMHWLGVQAPAQPEQPRILLVELPSALKPDPIGASASITKGAILPSDPTERHLALLLLIMFLAGTVLACVEVVQWWRRRIEQYGPPPLANLINYNSGPDGRWRATPVLRFSLSERLRSIRGYFRYPIQTTDKDEPKKAA